MVWSPKTKAKPNLMNDYIWQKNTSNIHMVLCLRIFCFKSTKVMNVTYFTDVIWQLLNIYIYLSHPSQLNCLFHFSQSQKQYYETFKNKWLSCFFLEKMWIQYFKILFSLQKRKTAGMPFLFLHIASVTLFEFDECVRIFNGKLC